MEWIAFGRGLSSMFKLHVADLVPSTNDLVKKALEEGKPEGFAVAARAQTQGYGRQGRIWASPEGGMYLSLLLRPCVPMERLATLSLVAAVAVRRALRGLALLENADSIAIKWPNDVVVVSGGAVGKRVDSGRFAKLCGISLEAHAGGICLGIGVNVMASSEGLQLEAGSASAKYVPAYMEDMGCADVEVVRTAVMEELERVYDQWQKHGLAVFLDELNACEVLRDRFVRICDRNGNIVQEGHVEGIDVDGCLMLRLVDGGLASVSSGEAHLA